MQSYSVEGELLRSDEAFSNLLSIIADSTLGADAASVDVQNIPATYAHLNIWALLRSTQAAYQSDGLLRFNNDSGANYNTSGGGNNRTSLEWYSVAGASNVADRFGTFFCPIPHYSSALNKTCELRSSHPYDAAGTMSRGDFAGIWRSTAVIDRITALLGSGNYLAASRFTLYGLGVGS